MATKRKSTVKKEEKHARRLVSIRKGFAQTAAAMGVSHLVAKLPRVLMDWLYTLPVLEPVVVPDAASAKRPNAAVVKDLLHERLWQASVKLDDGQELPVAHLLCFGLGLRECFGEILRKFKAPDLRQLAQEGQRLWQMAWDRHFHDALQNLNCELRSGAAHHARIDRELISFTLDWQQTPTGRRRVIVIFTLHDPHEITVRIDGVSRQAYRCGGHRGMHAPLEWVDWSSATLGTHSPDRVYPVFVQRHALVRLEERLSELGVPWAHFWMWESLREPRVVAREGERCLVEFRFFDLRLGYLIAQRCGQRMVVTTFIFLTMGASPEAELLRRNLRLGRCEIEYQKLDALATFVCTDVLDDPELLEIFRRCGCGHLAELRARCGKNPQAYAAELRKYLQLDDAEQRRALNRRMGLNMTIADPFADLASPGDAESQAA